MLNSRMIWYGTTTGHGGVTEQPETGKHRFSALQLNLFGSRGLGVVILGILPGTRHMNRWIPAPSTESALTITLMHTVPKILPSRPYGLKWRASPWFITLGTASPPGVVHAE